MGSFNNHVAKILIIFDPPPAPQWAAQEDHAFLDDLIKFRQLEL